MRLFLDSSVLLAACGSARGASREIFHRASAHGWVLITTPYVIAEVIVNLPDLSATAMAAWAELQPDLALMDDVLTLDRPTMFGPAKDKPILFSALAWSEVLLTLDRNDFGTLLGNTFYGLSILTPAMFLVRERAMNRLHLP